MDIPISENKDERKEEAKFEPIQSSNLFGSPPCTRHTPKETRVSSTYASPKKQETDESTETLKNEPSHQQCIIIHKSHSKPVMLIRCSDCQEEREVCLQALAQVSQLVTQDKKSHRCPLEKSQQLAVIAGLVIGAFFLFRTIIRK
jgi:hypothetical protein